ncbi:type I-E CRISPR-associated endoribonuclease Cas2e [uncultured Parvimonas sp.]|uniref:type I-E CRISPR-associated endoribonuclease Cas2e n=1 Tax=uncultured Parvimonas sp. TaxID=747372 RepID=UPI0028D058CE|nr:type I-E CRISPR-associated endoribonuclease Cas2e [uncultured Parvimonas sp.]
MPLTVITLKNVPPLLRGDLTKWMQEIATGVYIGNFNSKIRDNLWKRVKETSGCGEITLSFYCQNEIGYGFETINAKREVISYDGIPLIMIPDKSTETVIGLCEQAGYSEASKFRKARVFSSIKADKDKNNKIFNYTVIDIETDGLDVNNNSIIEIGAVKICNNCITTFQRLIFYEKQLPKEIMDLTGLDSEILKHNGINLTHALQEFIEFIGKDIIVGYNIEFDISFLNKFIKDLTGKTLNNQYIDLMKFIKKEKPFQKNYKLETSLLNYGINEQVPHRALSDARLIFELSKKVNKFLEKLK